MPFVQIRWESQSHTASHVAVVLETYSASILGKAVISCYFEHKTLVPKPRKKTHPVVFLLSSWEPPLSEWPINLKPSVLLYQIPWLTIPLMYGRIFLTTPMWWMFGLCMKREIKETACMMSSWVWVRYNRPPTIFLYLNGLASLELSYEWSFSLNSMDYQ